MSNLPFEVVTCFNKTSPAVEHVLSMTAASRTSVLFFETMHCQVIFSHTHTHTLTHICGCSSRSGVYCVFHEAKQTHLCFNVTEKYVTGSFKSFNKNKPCLDQHLVLFMSMLGLIHFHCSAYSRSAARSK